MMHQSVQLRNEEGDIHVLIVVLGASRNAIYYLIILPSNSYTTLSNILPGLYCPVESANEILRCTSKARVG